MKIDRRRFIQTAAGAGAALTASGLIGTARHLFAVAKSKKRLQMCMLSGSEEYKSNESLAAFQEFAEKNHAIHCSRAFWTSKTNLPGLEALDSSDVILIFTKRLELPDSQLQLIKKYCLAGRPIVGLRTASHAFQNWLELDREIFGGSYGGHYKGGITTKVEIAEGAAEHPVLRDIKPFDSPSKLYKNQRNADDTRLLLTGTIPDHTEPVAWTREHRGARVFYTSLGGPEDFRKDDFRRLIVNAIFWTARWNSTN